MIEKVKKSPPTITQIISGDLWAGAEAQVYNLCTALNASEEVRVTTVVFNNGILHDKLIDLGIPVTLADEESSGPLTIARAISHHCRTHHTDLIHTHGLKENVLGIMAKELARVPYSVRTVHGNPETRLSWNKPHKWLVNQLDVWLGRTRQQAVIAVSSQLEHKLLPLFPRKVHKIFNFINVDELRKGWLPKPERTSPEVKLGIVGRLVPVKRVDLFIRIIRLLSEEGVNCKGLIMGEGPLEAELKSLADDLRVTDRLNFTGFLNPAAKEMRNLDALLMTSDHEGLPMTLLEAMALEIPIIAHNTGGIPEILHNGQAGFLTDVNQPKSYIPLIIKLLNQSDSERKVMYKFAKDALANFDYRKNTEEYIRLYQDIIGNCE